jgi:hypothetical protein
VDTLQQMHLIRQWGLCLHIQPPLQSQAHGQAEAVLTVVLVMLGIPVVVVVMGCGLGVNRSQCGALIRSEAVAALAALAPAAAIVQAGGVRMVGCGCRQMVDQND